MYTSVEIRHQLADSGASVVVCQDLERAEVPTQHVIAARHRRVPAGGPTARGPDVPGTDAPRLRGGQTRLRLQPRLSLRRSRRLAPAYDLNPVPTDIKPRVLTTAIDLEDGTASLERAMEVAEYFELDPETARAIAGEVGQAVATWRAQAARLGLSKHDVDRMASAFEHDDLQAAVKARTRTGRAGR